MKAGIEFDALVAVKVMGCVNIQWSNISRENRAYCGCDGKIQLHREHGGVAPALPRYSTDIAAAWEVFQKMRSKPFSRRRTFMMALRDTVHQETGELVGWPDVFWFVTPRTICHAALTAMGVEVPA